MVETIKCPYCKSTNVVFRGYRYNEKTEKRLRLCRACGRKFTLRDRFFRMRHTDKEIMKAVSLYNKGFSSADVVSRLKRDGVKVSRWTILTWVKRFSK